MLRPAKKANLGMWSGERLSEGQVSCLFPKSVNARVNFSPSSLFPKKVGMVICAGHLQSSLDLLGDLLRDSVFHGGNESFECVHRNVSLRLLGQGPLWPRARPRALAGILNHGWRRGAYGWCVVSACSRSCRIADHHRYRSSPTDGANLIPLGISFVLC